MGNVFFVIFGEVEFFNVRHVKLLGYLLVSFLEEIVSSLIGREDVFHVCQIPFWLPSVLHSGVSSPFD